MIKTGASVAKSSKAVWGAVRALDFSFTSPFTLSCLKDAKANKYTVTEGSCDTAPKRAEKSKEDKENTAKSMAAAWTAVDSVRSLSVPAEDVSKLSELARVFLRDNTDVKLTAFDEDAMRLSFEILAPAQVTLSAEDAASVLPAEAVAGAVPPFVFPLVRAHSLTLAADGDDKCTVSLEANVADDAAAAASPLARAFCAAYHEFLLASLTAAVSGAYPFSPRRAVFDEYFGTTVADPFRWLEDPDSADTQAWVTAQNAATDAVLGGLDARERIREQLTGMYNYERYTMVRKEGEFYYYSKNDGLQNQYVMYQTSSITDPGRVFLDPTALDPSGTSALGSRAFSESGKLYAYGVCKNGSDWNTVFVKRTDTLEVLADELHWVKFSSIAWTHDDAGFFYCRYPAPSGLADADAGKRGTETDSAGGQAVYYHRVGTAQSEDVEVFSAPSEPAWMFGVTVSDCGKYVFISTVDSCDPVNRLFYFRLADFTAGDWKPAASVIKLVDDFESGYEYVTNDGARCLFKTNRAAPRSRVVALDLDAATAASAVAGGSGAAATAAVIALLEEVVPQHPTGGVLGDVQTSHGKMVLNYTVDVCDVLEVRSLDGKLDSAVDFGFLPKFSSLAVLGKKSSAELSIFVTNALYAGSAYVFDMSTGAHVVFKNSNPKGFDADKFVVEQVFFPSVDGTKIPMFITHKKGLALEGANPTYLYGYGGFNITLGPSFSINRWLWMEHFNGVAVVANMRGGGEYGNEWHKAGCHDKKQNVFDDFYSAAKYLVDNKYTSYSKIGVHGGSNGGLLIAASINQRPQSFGAAVAAVGVLDMLRFHKFTIGNAWCSDYGCSEESAKAFATLRAYSPLHTVPAAEAAALPPVMLTTADHDDRVVPLHSFKYIAEAQRLHCLAGPSVSSAVAAGVAKNALDKAPVVIRIETNAGHGAGKPLNKVIAEHADVFGFFAKYLGATWTA